MSQQTIQPEPTTCSRCKKSLSNYNWTSYYSGDTLVETICTPCQKKKELASYQITTILNSKLIMNNSLELFHKQIKDEVNDRDALLDLKDRIDIQVSYLELKKRIKDFDFLVWLKPSDGLQKIVRENKNSGLSAEVGLSLEYKVFSKFNMMMYTMAGRTMITIQDEDASITLITDETSREPRMGLQGIDASKRQAIALLDLTTDLFNAGQLKFKADDKVSLI